MKSYLFLLMLGFCLVACTRADAPSATKDSAVAAAPEGTIKPTITLSRERIPQNGWLKMYGKGFTPKSNVQSHLRRPDGTEFREISMMTDAQGEFVHDIDSLLLQRGVHDLWAEDSTTGLVSNVAHFTATDEPGPSEKPTHPTM